MTGKETNADRIRNMSDEELACVIEKIKMCGGLIRTETTSAECSGCKKMDIVVMLCNGFDQKQNRREYGR